MHRRIRSFAIAATLIAASALPVAAQQPGGVTADLITDISELEKKLVGLARAIPAEKYDWRPGEGVRSVGEVLMHVSADNYLLPAAALGAAPDPSTGIKGDDYKTALAYEKRKLAKDAVIAELEKSFASLKKAFSGTQPARLGEKIQMFGQTFTVQQAMILTATHLHEHLGQMIAYARTNSIKPPWS